MNKRKGEFIRVGFIHGLFAAAGLILYFLIMRIFGLAVFYVLHFVNFLILALFIVFGNRRLRKLRGKITYFNGLGTGFIVSLVASFLFAIFMFSYMNWLDPAFMSMVSGRLPFTELGSPGSAAVALWVEGLVGGFVTGFIVMQFMKDKQIFQEASHTQYMKSHSSGNQVEHSK